jgi:rare lipoprotein A
MWRGSLVVPSSNQEKIGMVVRFGAAICVAATMFVCSSSAFADKGVANSDSQAAEECLIGSGTNPDARVVAHDPDDSLPMSPEISGEMRATPNEAERGAPVRGVASMYNPYRPGWREGGKTTASGERYDPVAWTAAIKTGLRDQFGGVRYGKDYRPVYALVESSDKQVIVKINDVGPLTPGRVVDLNERAMQYFDPTLERGLIRSVKVTPLMGTYWIPGPVRSDC